jgi:hypothetical protein
VCTVPVSASTSARSAAPSDGSAAADGSWRTAAEARGEVL